MKLQKMVTGSFVLFALIPVLLVFFLLNGISSFYMRNMAQEIIAGAVETELTSVRDYIEYTTHDLQLFASLPDVKAALTEKSSSKAKDSLYLWAKKLSSLESLSLVTMENTVLLSTDTALAGKTIALETSAQEHLQYGMPAQLPLQRNDKASVGGYLFTLLVPVAQAGAMRGYVRCVLNTSRFAQIAQSLVLPYEASITVMDGHGAVAGTSYSGAPFALLSNLLSRASLPQQLVTQRIFEFMLDGQKYFGYAKKDSNTGWTILCMIPKNKLAIPKTALLMVLGFVAVVIIGLMLMLRRTMYRYFTNPMQILATNIRAIDAGNYNRSIPFLGNNEFGDIGKAFNKMMQRIDRDRQELSLREERNRIINEQSNSIIIEYNIETKQVTCSPNGRMLFNYPECMENFPEALVETQGICAEDAPAFETLFLAMCRGQKSGSMELRMRSYKEEYLWFNLLLTTITDPKTCKPMRVVGKLSDITAEKRKTETLTFKAERDSLTHLYNKATTHSLIADALAHHMGAHIDALMIMDIDCFKRVNDTYGHQKGDFILLQVAKALDSCFRPDDIVGRMGGDEFMVLMRSMPSVEVVEQKARTVVKAIRGVVLDEQTGETMSASIGIALCPQDGTLYTQLYSHADNALYATKKNGKDGYSLYRGSGS